MELAMKYHIQIVANKELSRIPAQQLPVAPALSLKPNSMAVKAVTTKEKTDEPT